MITSPQHGEENPERARFCVACGTPLVSRGSFGLEEARVDALLEGALAP